MIRLGEPRDTRSILELVKEFHSEFLKDYVRILEQHVLFEIVTLFRSGSIFVVSEKDGKLDGVVIAIKHRSLFDGRMVAQELMWYVSPSARKGRTGIELLKHFEKVCKLIGINQIVMVNLQNSSPESIGKLYKRFGYQEMEKHFIKEV